MTRSTTTFRPVSEAPRDGTVILARFRDDIAERYDDERARWAGLEAPLRYAGDGLDWSVALPVGVGGFPDDWIAGWCPSGQDAGQSFDEATQAVVTAVTALNRVLVETHRNLEASKEKAHLVCEVGYERGRKARLYVQVRIDPLVLGGTSQSQKRFSTAAVAPPAWPFADLRGTPEDPLARIEDAAQAANQALETWLEVMPEDQRQGLTVFACRTRINDIPGFGLEVSKISLRTDIEAVEQEMFLEEHNGRS